MKKVSTALLLLFCAVILSLLFDYKDSAVFLRSSKKNPIYYVDTNEKVAAITFDENWGEDNTAKILSILKKYNIKATFFIVGKWAEDNPGVLESIAKDGHEIGNHSYLHPDMTNISTSRIQDEIAKTDELIMRATGKPSTLFRCPEGSYNDNVVDCVEKSGHYCIQWNVDSIDWREQGADIEYNRVVKKIKPGSIILFHNNAKYTPDNLPRIIENLQKSGYKFVTVSDIIYKTGYYVDEEGKQVKK